MKFIHEHSGWFFGGIGVILAVVIILKVRRSKKTEAEEAPVGPKKGSLDKITGDQKDFERLMDEPDDKKGESGTQDKVSDS